MESTKFFIEKPEIVISPVEVQRLKVIVAPDQPDALSPEPLTRSSP